MKQASFRAYHRSSAVQTLLGRDSLKAMHLRAESITVHLQSFVNDLLAQEVGTPWGGRGKIGKCMFTYWGCAA